MTLHHWLLKTIGSTLRRESSSSLPSTLITSGQPKPGGCNTSSGWSTASGWNKRRWIGSWAAAGILLGGMIAVPVLRHGAHAYPVSVRVDRWLAVRRATGDVMFYRHNEAQAVVRGVTRLEQVGDRLTTGEKSDAALVLDTGIGFVDVSENTDIHVEELRTTPSGGRVTRLYVEAGQARLRTRPFLDPETELEIRTPAGVSAVRGTVFGITVSPDGQTGVLATEGQVTAEAQGVTVFVNAGFQSLIVPGFPPTEPVPISQNIDLDIRRLEPVDRGRSIRIVGQIDPVNQLVIEGETVSASPDGTFDITVPRPEGDRISATVSTLTGTVQQYELVIP